MTKRKNEGLDAVGKALDDLQDDKGQHKVNHYGRTAKKPLRRGYWAEEGTPAWDLNHSIAADPENEMQMIIVHHERNRVMGAMHRNTTETQEDIAKMKKGKAPAKPSKNGDARAKVNGKVKVNLAGEVLDYLSKRLAKLAKELDE